MPRNLSYFWNFGVLAGFFLVLQIVTAVGLTITPLLAQLGRIESHRIGRVVDWIRRHYDQPIRIEAYEFVPDKAGPGRYRGGVPFRRDYKFLEEEAVLQVRSDRRTHRPFGLYGGSPGMPSEESRTMPAWRRVNS